MTAHVKPELGAYVLGALDAEQAAVVRRHLMHCPSCAAEHAELAKLPALLELAASVRVDEPLPPAVEERVLDTFARDRGRAKQPRRRWARLAAAVRRHRRARVGLAVASLAAAAALAVTLTETFERDGAQRTAAYPVVLHPTAAVPRAVAHAKLMSVPSGTVMHLWVRGLPPGRTYEVRCGAESAGSFHVNARGRAYVVLMTAARVGQYSAIRVLGRPGGAVLGANLPI